MSELETVDKKNKFKKFGINMIIFAVLLSIAIIIFKFPEKEEKIVEKAEFSDVSKICELATLRCYYHDVAEFQKDPDGLFKYGLFRYGAKKMWMEYNGIVKIGIDVGQVKVEDPTEDGIVRNIRFTPSDDQASLEGLCGGIEDFVSKGEIITLQGWDGNLDKEILNIYSTESGIVCERNDVDYIRLEQPWNTLIMITH